MADVEWEARTAKPDRGRIGDLERDLVQRKIRREEEEMRARRRGRLKALILVPLSLVLVGAGTVVTLDALHIVHVGLFPPAPPPLVLPTLPPAQTATPAPIVHHANLGEALKAEPAPVEAPEPAPVAIAPAPVVREVDVARINRARDHAEHATHGIKIISEDIAKEQSTIYVGDQYINGTWTPYHTRNRDGWRDQLADAQVSDQAAWNAYNANHCRQNIDLKNAWDAEVTRLQVAIANQIEIDEQAQDHLNSLQGRLAKAQQDLVQASADYITAGGNGE